MGLNLNAVFCFHCDDNIILQYGKEHTTMVCQWISVIFGL